MPSPRQLGHGLLARLTARVVIAALVLGLLPASAQASLPATSPEPRAPRPDLPLRESRSVLVLAVVLEGEAPCAVLLLVADPFWDPFTGMDPWEGSAFDPPTLHRYLYVRNDPGNRIDPSGRYEGVLGLTVANSIRNVLAEIHASFGQAVINQVSGENEFFLSQFLLGGAAVAIGGFVATKLVSRLRKLLFAGDSIAEELELVAKIRNVLKVEERRNIAFATLEVDGVVGQVIAVSGARSRPGTAGVPTVRQFQTLTVTFDRSLDSEVKILEDLAVQLREGAEGMIRLFSERQPCASCQGVIEQFRERFPKVALIIKSGS